MNFRSFVFASYLAISSLSAQTLIPITYYGYLDQYSMNAIHNLVGNDACVPTSTTNALTFLQNFYPEIYGSALSGTNYSDWKTTDSILIGLMGTQANVGTYDTQFVYGLNAFFDTINLPAPVLTGVFYDAGWGGAYPRPSYISDGHPTLSFFESMLMENAAVITTISYLNGGGHGILVNGIDWNSETQTGTLYFVDPLDPSQNYDAQQDPEVLGPTKQTMGTLSLNEHGHILLTYDQYEGGLPYSSGNYASVSAVIDGALALRVIPEPSAGVLLMMGLGVAAVCRPRHRGIQQNRAGGIRTHDL